MYDLEVPLKVQCKNFQVEPTDIYTTARPEVTWSQSKNINVDGWHTDVYVRIKGTNKEYPWSEAKDVDSGYVKDYGLYKDVMNYKRKVSFKVSDWDLNFLYPGGDKGFFESYQHEGYYIRLRNYKYDSSTKLTHSSNWVTWYVDKDGKVKCVENKDHDVTNTDDDNVDTTSKNYDPTEDYTQKNDGGSSTKLTLDSFLNSLNSAIASVGEIPNMMGVVFGWLPTAFITFIVSGIGLIVLLRILGR